MSPNRKNLVPLHHNYCSCELQDTESSRCSNLQKACPERPLTISSSAFADLAGA